MPGQAFDFYANGLASGSDSLYTPFLGIAPRPERTYAYAQKNSSKLNMPEAYIGQNEYIRDTIEDLTLTAKWDWMTERILMWFRTENIHLTWSEWVNNPHFMAPTPHQTTSRLVTSRRTVHKASIVRRGIATEFEHDFVKTAFGRSKFMSSLQQMARSLQETANVLGIRELLGCHRNQHQFAREHNVPSVADLDAYHERDVNRFMTVQKDVNGLSQLTMEIDGEMEMWGGEADTWIVDRRVFEYATTVPPEAWQYWLAGPDGPGRLNGTVSSGTAAANTMGNLKNLTPPRMISGSVVLLAKSQYQELQGKVELLSRQREIGIYNLMVDRVRDHRNYSSASRNLKVYDNQNDNWAEIEFIEALKNCVAFDRETGKLLPAFGGGAKMRAGMSADVQDEQDWCSYAVASNSKVRQDLEYVGDMSANFLEMRHIVQGAQTLLDAITQGGSDKSMNQTLETAAGSLMTRTAITRETDTDAALTDMTEILKGFLGDGNLLLKGTDNLDKLLRMEVEPVAPLTSAAIGGRVSASNSEKSHRVFLMDLLGAAVPEHHRPKLESIVDRTQDLWSDRARAIKELVLHIQASEPGSIEALPDAIHVDKWYNKHYQQYDTKVKADAAAAAAASESLGAAAGRSSIPIGAPIPHGYRAVAGASGRTILDLIGCHNAGVPGAVNTTRADRMAMRKVDTSGAGKPRPNLEKHITAITKATGISPILKVLAIAFVCTEFNSHRFIEMAQRHIYVPIGLALLRIHCTYKTLTGIKVASGGRAGYTVFGHSDVQVAHDAARKVGIAHYTTYLSAIVTNPKLVYIVQDMYCERYLGGMDVTFWPNASAYKNAHNRRHKSILCIPLPPNVKKLEKKIDVRGRWYTEYQLGLVSDERYALDLYPGAARMNALCGWADANRKDLQSKRTGGAARNMVVWQGHEWYFNTKNGTWDDWTPEAGHMGSKVRETHFLHSILSKTFFHHSGHAWLRQSAQWSQQVS